MSRKYANGPSAFFDNEHVPPFMFDDVHMKDEL